MYIYLIKKLLLWTRTIHDFSRWQKLAISTSFIQSFHGCTDNYHCITVMVKKIWKCSDSQASSGPSRSIFLLQFLSRFMDLFTMGIILWLLNFHMNMKLCDARSFCLCFFFHTSPSVLLLCLFWCWTDPVCLCGRWHQIQRNPRMKSQSRGILEWKKESWCMRKEYNCKWYDAAQETEAMFEGTACIEEKVILGGCHGKAFVRYISVRPVLWVSPSCQLIIDNVLPGLVCFFSYSVYFSFF